MSKRSQRKDDHVVHALAQTNYASDFDNIRLFHNSLPGFNLSDVSTQADYFGQTFAYPIYINAMTGGSEKTKNINQKLARIAAKFDLAIAVGSQHVALDDAEYEESFKIVREENPHGFVIGNVNANATIEEAKRAVAMINANALGIHINVAQELPMDEGDRDFAHWLEHIQTIVEQVGVPVIVKEVGFGMNAKTVESLYRVGVRYVDVSGKGGTNFIDIENSRSERKRYDYLSNWGISAVESLLMNQTAMDKMELIGSGGVKTPLDVIKLLALGAKAVGISKSFLLFAHMEEALMMEEVSLFLEDIRKCMVLVGAQNMHALRSIDYRLLNHLEVYNETK